MRGTCRSRGASLLIQTPALLGEAVAADGQRGRRAAHSNHAPVDVSGDGANSWSSGVSLFPATAQVQFPRAGTFPGATRCLPGSLHFL